MTQPIYEAAAPGYEQWAKDNRDRFVKMHGEKKGIGMLCATTWKMHAAAMKKAAKEALKDKPMNESFATENGKKGSKIAWVVTKQRHEDYYQSSHNDRGPHSHPLKVTHSEQGAMHYAKNESRKDAGSVFHVHGHRMGWATTNGHNEGLSYHIFSGGNHYNNGDDEGRDFK